MIENEKETTNLLDSKNTSMENMRSKNVSEFHIQAERAKTMIKENEAYNEDPLNRKFQRYNRNKKGKAEGVNDKVKNAGVGDWVEHKLAKYAFFELMRKLFIDQSQISKTFENISVDKEKLPENPDELVVISEDKINEKDDEKMAYVALIGDKMEENYLKNGLSKEEADLRLKTYGPNALPEPKKTPEIIKYLMEITSVFPILLWIAAILSFIAYGLAPDDLSNMWLGLVVVIIVLLTGLFSYIQNAKSSDIIDSFKSFNSATVIVTRDGEECTIPAQNIVKGDVVHIRMGEKVPADLRMFNIVGDLQFDNSPLTGESIPIAATRFCGEKGASNALEATNLAFFSTNCKEGRGTGVCIRIGAGTFMGKIADLASGAEGSESTFQREINNFIFYISFLSIGCGLLFFFSALAIGYNLIENVIFTIGIVVANVPEGLISTVTVALAITAKKMLKYHIMVKNLESVETLGSITCICSDKTGTLTKNKMTVVHVFYDGEIKKTSESQQNLRDEYNKEIPMEVYDEKDKSFHMFKFSAVCGSVGEFLRSTPEDYLPVVQGINHYKKMNPTATFDDIKNEKERLLKHFSSQYMEEYNKNIDDRYTNTDASESGIIKFFEKIESINKIRSMYPLHTQESGPVSIPFNSVLKFACFLRRDQDNNFILALKGAPERVMARCTHYLKDGEELDIDGAFEEKFRKANQSFALKGERVIAVAFKRLDPMSFPPNYIFEIERGNNEGPKGQEPKVNFPITELTFGGLIAMEDPPRDGVREAISICKRAGIKVIMVTGDQPLTAASIANQIGIIEDIDDTPELIMRREALPSLEEAEAKSNAIIIAGPRLQAALDRDSSLSDDNDAKNSFLRHWLMKRDVVFARTSPENKLTIVDACQKLSHVVAVTGDGVNDSPAIKKADIGIAMGKVGTDVAKDAADILLLDDNFPSILKGIKQGRVVFDILKKIIGYNLTSNMIEFIPFLLFVVCQIPLPMTTILILCIDVGTDVFPNLTQSYEHPESGVMDRKPRNAKKDKLCTVELMCIGYLVTGVLETFACMLTYFVILNDYGFKAQHLPFFAFLKGTEPAAQDILNPYDNAYKGNSRYFMSEKQGLLGLYGESKNLNILSRERAVNWSLDDDISIDLRLFYPEKDADFWGKCKLDSRGQNYDDYVCYRVEALRHSNGAYLLSAVFMQFANSFNYRTKELSIFKHKMDNYRLLMSIVWEYILVNIIIFVPGLNTAFATRPIRVEHYFITLGFYITHFYFGEILKWLVRNSRKPDGSPGFFRRFFFY